MVDYKPWIAIAISTVSIGLSTYVLSKDANYRECSQVRAKIAERDGVLEMMLGGATDEDRQYVAQQTAERDSLRAIYSAKCTLPGRDL